MLIIVNPAAAGGRVGREWPRVRERLPNLCKQAEIRLTEAPGHAAELAADGVRGGETLVVAVGGDGTACEAAEGICRAGGGVLAILPLGTGNDAARTLGIPLQLDAAARVAVDGHHRHVDLIRVGDKLVLNAIGIGLTADINQRAAQVKVVRGICVYLITALISLVSYSAPRVRLRTPDSTYDGTMIILAVHNGPTTGGGFRLTPRATPADGLLDACLVPEMWAAGRLRRLVAAVRGTLNRLPGSLELQAPWLELEFDSPIPVHLDGNQAVLQPPVARFEIVPRALRVAVPRSQDLARLGACRP